eukprot:SAG31_NODE_3667_length_4007_cov_1.970317_3_plen_241_part_00
MLRHWLRRIARKPIPRTSICAPAGAAVDNCAIRQRRAALVGSELLCTARAVARARVGLYTVTLSRLVPYISRLKSRVSRIVAQKRESNTPYLAFGWRTRHWRRCVELWKPPACSARQGSAEQSNGEVARRERQMRRAPRRDLYVAPQRGIAHVQRPLLPQRALLGAPTHVHSHKRPVSKALCREAQRRRAGRSPSVGHRERLLSGIVVPALVRRRPHAAAPLRHPRPNAQRDGPRVGPQE